MKLNLNKLSEFHHAKKIKNKPFCRVENRISPSRFQYNFLHLKKLTGSILKFIDKIQKKSACVALDIGSGHSPYRCFLEEKGCRFKTLDITLENGADYIGIVENTNLANESFDIVICTQVLEHCQNPWLAIQEISRILKPDGILIASVPHVWFYHPHPTDHWRFTQEGCQQLCVMGNLNLLELHAQGGSILTFFQIINFLIYGIIGKIGAPLYFLINSIALPFDRLISNNLFCHNFAFIAQKPNTAD